MVDDIEVYAGLCPVRLAFKSWYDSAIFVWYNKIGSLGFSFFGASGADWMTMYTRDVFSRGGGGDR